MFDSITAEKMKRAPAVPGLNPNDIPALITRHYASLVSARLGDRIDDFESQEGVWPLERIADTYELMASLLSDENSRSSASFVAATAQQILARRDSITNVEDTSPLIDIGFVSAAISAPLLFLAAEQYADAFEAAAAIRPRNRKQLYEAQILSENIYALARGNLEGILSRATRWRRLIPNRTLDEQAFAALLEMLILGIEALAARFLGETISGERDRAPKQPNDIFVDVINLSKKMQKEESGQEFLSSFDGPARLASILSIVSKNIEKAALIDIPAPADADVNIWGAWLKERAKKFPFVWPNHREAVQKDFCQTGKSAVIILPTGAGKTTISSLKIAGVLARRKKVIFLAPTHALVEQLTTDLQETFDESFLGSIASNDFDLLFESDSQVHDIEVMTPERCLMMLSFVPEAFEDVGLLVFDECHLLSPQSGKIRRALDSMLCLLRFNYILPDADLLFMSAMLKNGHDFSEWISSLTGRDSICVDLLWKPSRQARGVVIYREAELAQAKQEALAIQKEEDEKKQEQARDLRRRAQDLVKAYPFAIWGLEHNWLDLKAKTANIITTQLLDKKVPLSGSLGSRNTVEIKPNANEVAAFLAVSAAKNNLKSIIFVNQKKAAISVASNICKQLSSPIESSPEEEKKWEALAVELGGIQHALFAPTDVAVPHNASMLYLERQLAEGMFKREAGAKVIVATPTLAQGLNLPAHFAVLAGDKRARPKTKERSGGRDSLEAHEILNAAARSGRAGHLANGVVLLVPEPVISFSEDENIDANIVQKMKSLFPEDDRCVLITDPLEAVLDKITIGDTLNVDVRYLINRMSLLDNVPDASKERPLFDLRTSLGAFLAQKRSLHNEFAEKIEAIKAEIKKTTIDGMDQSALELASQSGLSLALLIKLKERILKDIGKLPETIEGWVNWVMNWFAEDEAARNDLFYETKKDMLSICGQKNDNNLSDQDLDIIKSGLIAWVKGLPLADIERTLGGDLDKEPKCPRARLLVTKVIPQGFSFIFGLVSSVVRVIAPYEQQESLSGEVVENLGVAIRKGYDLPEKVAFAASLPKGLSRVQVHELWRSQSTVENHF